MKTQKTSLLAACTLLLGLVPAALAGTDADAHFKLMDANGDGQVTRAEHNAAARKMFTEADANRDGTLTAAEMDAMAVAKGEKVAKDDLTAAEKIKVAA